MSQQHPFVDQTELHEYKVAVEDVLNGKLNEDRFMAMRLQQGIYGQREDGVNMVRVKLPGGHVQAQQLEGVAEVLEQYSREAFAGITTRQDIQLHTVPLADTPAALYKLAEYGLTSREACGNTVRNITACPLAGVCPKEHTDVQHYVQATAQRYLRSAMTQHLPRKIKMSFSGCDSDCAQAMIHDIGVIATHKDGIPGFTVKAAGGLGHKPHPAVTIEDFVEEKDLLPVIEAVLAVHNKYSDRERRARSRLKFLVDRFGAEGFIEKYQEALQRTREVFAQEQFSKGEWFQPQTSDYSATGAPGHTLEQRQAGLYVMPVGLNLGDLSPAQLRGIAAIMRDFGIEVARATQDQNLILLNAKEADVASIEQRLQQLELGIFDQRNDVVACPGTWTCRLGVTNSRALADKLCGNTDLRVRVSGCHNGCAQPYVGDIGLYGEGRRKHGKLLPHYRMYFGGDASGEGVLGRKGPEIVAARVEPAVKEVYAAFEENREEGESFVSWSQRQEADFFDTLLERFTQLSEFDISLVSTDHGQEESFRVVPLGGGECMGAPQETVAANFSEAAHERGYRRSFLLGRKYEQALDCAEAIAHFIGKSILYVTGYRQDIEDLDVMADLLNEHAGDQPEFGEALQGWNQELKRLQESFDVHAFEKLAEIQDGWTVLAAEYCQKHDNNLNLANFLPATPALAKAS